MSMCYLILKWLRPMKRYVFHFVSITLMATAIVPFLAVPAMSDDTGLEDTRKISMQYIDNISDGNQQYLNRNGEQKLISAAIKQVVELLKDPESAKIRKARMVRYQGKILVCGEVNAKNSYGGYVGYTRFIAGAFSAVLEYKSSDPDFAAAANYGLSLACSQ